VILKGGGQVWRDFVCYMRNVQRLLTFHEEATGIEAPHKIGGSNHGVVEDVMQVLWNFEELYGQAVQEVLEQIIWHSAHPRRCESLETIQFSWSYFIVSLIELNSFCIYFILFSQLLYYLSVNIGWLNRRLPYDTWISCLSFIFFAKVMNL